MNIEKLIGGSVCGALAVLAAGWAGPARGQAADSVRPSLLAAAQGITAHGHGEVKARPDIARLTAGVVTQGRDQAQAVQDNARKMTALIAAVKGLRIADRDIQTQGYSVQPQYDYGAGGGRPPTLKGYQVTNSVQVTLRDLSQAGSLIDRVTQAGGNQVDGLTYDLSSRDAAQDQALTLAAKDAARRADTMAAALNLGLGNVLSLSDGEATPVQPVFLARAKTMNALSDAAPETPVAPQEITVTADVTLVYAVSPLRRGAQ